jgi:hypothetical protein
VLLVVAVALAVWAALDLRQAYTALRAAESAAARAQTALLDGDMDIAADQFAGAEERFADARQRLDSPPVRVAGLVPGAGRNLAVVRALSESGALVADAGGTASTALLELPGGTQALAPQGGRLPVDRIAELAPALHHVAAQIDAADQRMAAAPTTWLLPAVGQARTDFAARLEAVVEPARAGATLVDALPAFLGAEGPRRYFFGAQNPAELRGTGGLIGAWAVVTVREGRLDFGDFETIGTLTLFDPEEARAQPPPTEEYGARYTRFGAAGHGSNINVTPDFPTAAEAILNLHERQRGERLDGVILADPYMFEALLRVTGPVDVPDVRRIDADTVVDFVTRDQYADFDETDLNRKPVMGEVAKAALERFLTDGGEDPARSFRVLGQVAGAGHLLLHSSHADEQDAFLDTRIGGAFPTAPHGALFAVITNNAGANKLDSYLEQELDYEIWLAEDGSARGRARIRFVNTAPTSGFHRTVLGPNFDGVSGPGENLLYVSTYCAPACALVGVTRDGEPSTLGVEQELGAVVFPTAVRLPSGSEDEMVLTWQQPDVWDGTTFHLVLPEQPLMRPPARTITVHPPVDWALSTRHAPPAGEDAAVRLATDERARIELELHARPASSWWERVLRERAG